MRVVIFLLMTLFVSVAALADQPAARSVEVFKSPSCGCCGKWVDHLKANGFSVVVRDVRSDMLRQIKQKAGVPQKLASCHTARIGRYFVEGHVPAEDIKKLLEQKPIARGLAVPGMPIGSPGMEMGDKKEAYDVLLVKEDATTEVYATR